MSESDSIQVEGTVVGELPKSVFQVELANGHRVLTHIAPQMRGNLNRVLQGDKVMVEISPYDLTRGRIILRQSE